MIKIALFEFITGTFVPLALFPLEVQNSMKLFPFYYVYYYPSTLLIHSDTDGVPLALSVLIGWNLFIVFIIHITYKVLRRKFEGVGV